MRQHKMVFIISIVTTHACSIHLFFRTNAFRLKERFSRTCRRVGVDDDVADATVDDALRAENNNNIIKSDTNN